jgi:FtsP/CotA-like multicopper oxidase with cupredoxin domain
MPPPPPPPPPLALPLALALLCLAALVAPVTVVCAQDIGSVTASDGSSTGAAIDLFSSTGPAPLALFEFNLTITNGICAPDGFNRSCVLTNGQFPAPTLVVRNGDRLRILVRNRLTDPNTELATTIHWHGLHQVNFSHMDGQMPTHIFAHSCGHTASASRSSDSPVLCYLHCICLCQAWHP